ncbi:ubiquitin carboxyl-terminal hydrolase 8 [Plakobranchus ocellatus]|uniref:Ubiquitin carboxyl-terminal hydrolase 8 n=1 Tax=Plakobranchus ocellatus TaxID=259542 RepID=A0AAV4DIP6_9GAST|nr:ubiquitin carboxyl-terminal hydrolase 8 [Plakobranchus ocellatus]
MADSDVSRQQGNYVWKHSSFFGAKAHQVGCDFHLVEALDIFFVYYRPVLHQSLCWIRERGYHQVITHNSTDRHRTNHKTSLVTQIIKLTCSWLKHSNCDTQSVRSAVSNRVVSSLHFPLVNPLSGDWATLSLAADTPNHDCP